MDDRPMTMRDLIRRYRLLGPFVVLYMVVFGIAALVQHNSEFIYYTAVMTLLILSVIAIDRRVVLSRGVLWGLALWGLAHMCGGTIYIPGPTGTIVPYQYRPSPDLPRYDQMIHVYGFAVATVACWESLGGAVEAGQARRVSSTIGLVIAAMLMSMGLGALNELIEFIATRILSRTNIGGYENTGWDLVSNQVGIVGAGLVLAWRHRAGAAP